jgi:hypothetical protein
VLSLFFEVPVRIRVTLLLRFLKAWLVSLSTKHLTRNTDRYTVATAALAAGTAAAGLAYLDAKFHIRHDLASGSLANTSTAAQDFIVEREASNKLLLYHCLEAHAANTPNRPFLEFEDRKWTYGEFLRDLQRVGNWLITELGVQRDGMVALDGANSAEFLLLWFALEGVGAKVAFVNCHLTGQGLVHCVKVSYSSL